MKEITIYTGKNKSVKVDLDNLLSTDVAVLGSIPYGSAKKHPEFISAIEVCIEDCLDTVIEVVDEETYNYAMNHMILIVGDEKEETIMTASTVVNVTTETIKEEKGMVKEIKGNMEAAVQEMMGHIVEAKENIKVNADEVKVEYVEKLDYSINIMKGALATTLTKASSILGYDSVKEDILGIIEAGTTNKSSKKDLWKMAHECRQRIDDEIELLLAWGDEDSFKKATQLKALSEGVRGKSIFEAFVSGVIWVAKKVTRKLRAWFQVDEEKSVIGAICRSLSGFVSVIRAGVKIVFNTVKFAVSFVVAGAIKIGYFVFHAVKGIFEKVKGWAVAQYQKLTNQDVFEDEEDEFEFDESYENDIEEEDYIRSQQ